mgnify:CR=1 FL=1
MEMIMNTESVNTNTEIIPTTREVGVKVIKPQTTEEKYAEAYHAESLAATRLRGDICYEVGILRNLLKNFGEWSPYHIKSILTHVKGRLDKALDKHNSETISKNPFLQGLRTEASND